MRILVGHDYYDRGMGLGHDPGLVFVREKERFLPYEQARAAGLVIDLLHLVFEDVKTGEALSRNRHDVLHVKGTEYAIRRVAAVVCGKKHNGLLVSTRSSYPYASDETYFWSLDALNEWLGRHGLRVRDGNRSRLPWHDEGVKLDSYFGVKDLPPSAFDYVVAERLSILTWVENLYGAYGREEAWRVNGDNLKAIQFFKAIDAYTLFQELAMWVGGVLPRPGNPMVEITDDRVKAEKHGFDKWSFRKPPKVA